MIEADSNHCGIVAESLAGKRQVDEQTFASLAVLGERLERLKERNEIFCGVAFSSAVERLQARRSVVMVG
jgi:hypothetical protein